MTVTTSGILGVDTTAESETQVFALGTRIQTPDGQEYVYVQANGAITQYHWVGVDENYQAASLTKAMADDGWMIAVAQIAFTDNYYGWVCTRGANISAVLAGGTDADSALYTTGTAGVVSATSTTAQTNIDGAVAVASAVGASAGVSSAKEVILTWPRSTTF